MAQNSDGLQEPSMDELLTSIRKIIEENTGASPQENTLMRRSNAPERARYAAFAAGYFSPQ